MVDPHPHGEPCCGVCERREAIGRGEYVAPERSDRPLRVGDGQQLWLVHRGVQDIVVDHFPFTVGRKASNSYAVRDVTVSRHVLKVEVDADGHVFVSDLGSGCGTWLFGQQIQTAQLHERDEILIGSDTYLVFEVRARVPVEHRDAR